MDVNAYIAGLIQYAREKELLPKEDVYFARNQLLSTLGLAAYAEPEAPAQGNLPDLLAPLVEDAIARGVIQDSGALRDLLDTALMGALIPRPGEVARKFWTLYRQQGAKAATDWFYDFCRDCNYIRRDRIARDMRWITETEYGPLDITINLSKPEKDPKDIAAARQAPKSGYPACMLCMENEGYAGRVDFPARQNLRIIPIQVAGEDWGLQYSPYVYYNEHCIVLNSRHVPMIIDRRAFAKLLSFVEQFPHYFLGSNADLPIVGGSILSHEHFQGGRYVFAMEKAPVERDFTVPGYEDVACGVVKWPMSVLRVRHPDPQRLCDLADHILGRWRRHSDPALGILAETDGVPHNTITPIARRRGEAYELDLVLRCNITTPEHPLGVFHPHAALHNIKKENIGLIEVMGLAVLPSRLKGEMEALAQAILAGADLSASAATAKHAAWYAAWKDQAPALTAENIMGVLQEQIGQTFRKVLLDAGVYKRDAQGQAGLDRFLKTL